MKTKKQTGWIYTEHDDEEQTRVFKTKEKAIIHAMESFGFNIKKLR